MRLSDFHVKNNDFPLIANTDELIVMHRDAMGMEAVVFVGAHKDATVQVRSHTNRETVATATPWLTFSLPTGGKRMLLLPGTGNPLHLVSKFVVTSGAIFVSIASMGEYDAYFKQVDVPTA